MSKLAANGILISSAGIISSMIMPVPWYFLIITIGGGILTIGSEFARNEFEPLFKGLQFHNKEGEMPILIRKEKFKFGHNYQFTLPAGLNMKHWENIKMSIEQFLDAKIKIKYERKVIHITAMEVKLCDYYPFELIKCDPMEFIVGYSQEGPIKLKLKSHMLICGASGFGKSTFERGLLVYLIHNNKPSELILNLCDFKRNELGLFKYSKYVNTFATDKEGLIKLLIRLENEAIKRYELFENERVLDIERYNIGRKKLPYIINVIDEVAQCEGDKKIMGMLQKRISYDRAAGIFYIVCTQRPSVDLIPGSVKANIDTRVCFKTVDSTNSWIVLDDKEAAQYLETPGRGLLRNIDLIEFQAMYISEEEVTEHIKHTFRR